MKITSIKDDKEDASTDTGSVTRTEANTPCEEWHKSISWTWSAKANACVYRVLVLLLNNLQFKLGLKRIVK